MLLNLSANGCLPDMDFFPATGLIDCLSRLITAPAVWINLIVKWGNLAALKAKKRAILAWLSAPCLRIEERLHRDLHHQPK